MRDGDPVRVEDVHLVDWWAPEGDGANLKQRLHGIGLRGGRGRCRVAKHGNRFRLQFRVAVPDVLECWVPLDPSPDGGDRATRRWVGFMLPPPTAPCATPSDAPWHRHARPVQYPGSVANPAGVKPESSACSRRICAEPIALVLQTPWLRACHGGCTR